MIYIILFLQLMKYTDENYYWIKIIIKINCMSKEVPPCRGTPGDEGGSVHIPFYWPVKWASGMCKHHSIEFLVSSQVYAHYACST